MEVAYSVGVSNRFASLMAEDDDPGDQIIRQANVPEKVEKDKKKDAKGGKQKQKDNREKSQQARKSVQDSAKQTDNPPSAGRGRGGRQDNRRGQGGPGVEREFYPRGEGRGGRGGRPRLSSRDKENDGGFSSGERGFSGGERGFSGGERGFSGGERGFSGGERGFSGGERGFSGGDRGFSGGDREDRGEGRGRGVGRFRGVRGGGGVGGGRGGFRGKREFERRSGSDKSSVKAVEKREGGGAHNWGKTNDVDDWPEDGEEPQPPPTATDQTEAEQNGDTSTVEKTENPTDEGTEENENENKKEEEENQPREMTLDEYKAHLSKTTKETIRQDTSERKPGENVDSSQWKNTVRYERTEGEYFAGTREVIEKPKTSGRIKTTLDANFFFKDPARRGGRGRSGEGRGRGRGGESGRDRGEGGRGRGSEGGREGGRGRGGEGGRGGDGGRGRGEGRGEERKFRSDRRDRAPNVEDKFDFPTLPGAPATAVEQ